MKHITDTSHILLEEVQVSHHKLLDVLHTSASACVAFPVNEALLEPATNVWQTSAMALPTCKCTNKKYYVLAKDSGFLFSQLNCNCDAMLIMVPAVQFLEGSTEFCTFDGHKFCSESSDNFFTP